MYLDEELIDATMHVITIICKVVDVHMRAWEDTCIHRNISTPQEHKNADGSFMCRNLSRWPRGGWGVEGGQYMSITECPSWIPLNVQGQFPLGFVEDKLFELSCSPENVCEE